MGPRSFDRGNDPEKGLADTVIGPLQWGRDHSIAEINSATPLCGRLRRCFNGAAIIRSRKWRYWVKIFRPAKASMGPRSFDRGNSRKIAEKLNAKSCFNGAAIIRSRKCAVSLGSPVCLRSFNGAAIIRSRKYVRQINPSGKEKSFNGAAIIRSRKCSCWPRAWRDFHGFNGAAIIRSRKSTGDLPNVSRCRMLQWGRDHSIAEIK